MIHGLCVIIIIIQITTVYVHNSCLTETRVFPDGSYRNLFYLAVNGLFFIFTFVRVVNAGTQSRRMLSEDRCIHSNSF